MAYRKVKILRHEVGLHFVDGEFQGLLQPGTYHRFGRVWNETVEVVSRRAPWLVHEQLDVIAKSGALEGHAEVLDVTDHQRVLVWVDGRFEQVLDPGLYAYWTGFREVRAEWVDARQTRLEHPDLAVITRTPLAFSHLQVMAVPREHAGVLYLDGEFAGELGPGTYAFWRERQEVFLELVDLRQSLLEIPGQELMTADRVTLRLNAQATYRVVDARQAASVSHDVRQALYRDAQLALRAAVVARELDAFLSERDGLVGELAEALAQRAPGLGVEVLTVGVRDIILPGEMKSLLNRVTEAKAAAEANLIARREETAAMRSQANTAKLLENNPTLMRLRELEVLEKIATSGHLQVLLGEKGLSDRIVNML